MKYMDKALSSEERVKELLKIMTTEVKLAQLRTKLLQNYITDDGMQNVVGVIASECKARGIRQVLSTTVDIARDLRWGRVEFCFQIEKSLNAFIFKDDYFVCNSENS